MRSLWFEKLFGNFGDDPVALVAPRKGTNIRRNEYNESRDQRLRAWLLAVCIRKQSIDILTEAPK